jgi:hypothetical protein
MQPELHPALLAALNKAKGIIEQKPGDASDDARAEVKRLAKLGRIEYERERVSAAKRLSINLGTLDAEVRAERANNRRPASQGRAPSLTEVEPWPEAISLAEVLNDAVAAYSRYLILPAGGAEKMALWSFMTHCFECFAIIPRLAVTAADKECAKSLVLRILRVTSARAVIMTNANIAPLFRVISSHRPSIFLDEADNYMHDKPELLTLLNDGYAAGGCVWRCEGEANEVREYAVFAPVAIAMIERPADTLLSRCIEIRMKRKKSGERTANFRGDRPDQTLQIIQRKFARAALDLADRLRSADPDMGNLFNRDADNWRPMFAIADLAGGDWPGRVREIASAAIAQKAEQSNLDKLLADIRWLFDGGEDGEAPTDRMTSAHMVDCLVKIEGRPWGEWKSGKPITQNGLARMLGRLTIQSCTIRLQGDITAKGYYRAHFEDAFARHLPPQSVTPSQLNNDGHCDALQNVTSQNLVTLSKTSQPNNDGHCDAVTDSTTGPREQISPIDEERAAVIEYDGRAPRAWAEASSRLHPDRPPPEVSVREWSQFYDDYAKFMDGWGRKASALRWKPSDVLGWDPSRRFTPSARGMGLAWQIHGGRVVDIARDTATVIQNGRRLIFGREGPSSRWVICSERTQN